MKTKTFKKLLASMLAFLMLFGGVVPSALAAEMDSLNTEIGGDSIQPEDELTDEVMYDAQPTTLDEVWEAITAYVSEYNAVLDELGLKEALKVQKSHWEYEVPEEIMPDGYHCMLVDDDENFVAEYYTFFKNEDDEDEDDKDDIVDEDDEDDIDDIDDQDEEDEILEIVYDSQPQTMDEVQAVIDAYEVEHLAVLEADGFIAALEVTKPHWQYEVPEDIMPDGYHCELVDWDEEFGAEYYTFFPNPVAVADGPPYGDGKFANEPPKGSDITKVFNIVSDASDARLDSKYHNVAILTMDTTDQFGGMWSKDTLDLRLPFTTEMEIHLGHEYNKGGIVADGMTFTLQADGPTAIGGMGEGLGVYHGRTAAGESDARWLTKAISIEFDTYRNQKDGQGNVLDPVLPGNGNTAHCALIIPNSSDGACKDDEHKKYWWFTPTQNWEKFEVEWEPYITDGVLGGTLTYTFMGVKSEYEIEDVSAIFGDTTEVYWGFTGATGGSSSVQAAAITKLPIQEFMAEKTVFAAGVSVDGGEAKVGDTLSYTIKATALMAIEGIGKVIITDELSQYVRLAEGKVTMTTSEDMEPVEVEYELDDNIMTIYTEHILANSEDWLEVTFDVIVLEDGGGETVTNAAVVYADNLSGPKETNTTEVEIIKGSRKLVAASSEAGYSGAAVSIGDEIIYRIEYINPMDDVANVTITDDLDLGLEFVLASDEDKLLGEYEAGVRSIVWKINNVEPGEGGHVTLTVKVTTEAGAAIRNVAQMEWDTGSGEGPEIEEPDVVNPVKSYKIVDETSDHGVNGDPVTLGDKIIYRIGYINPTGEDASLTITDVLDKGLSYVGCTGGGEYDLATGTVTWNIGKVEADGYGSVTLTAVVTKEAGAFITNKANLKWEVGGEEIEPEEPEVTNPVFPYKIVDESSEAGKDGSAVAVGDLIIFKIGYINPRDAIATLTITDELKEGLTYNECSSGGVYEESTNTVTWEIEGVGPGIDGFVTLMVQVNENAKTKVQNTADLSWAYGDGEVNEQTEIEIPIISYKIVDIDSDVGVDGDSVKVGDEITYRIGYINPTGEVAKLVITDELPKGLEYVIAKNESGDELEGYNSVSRSFEWTITDVPEDGYGYITLTAVVTKEAGAYITNKANLSWIVGDEKINPEEPEVTNPVFPYKIVDDISAAGLDGASVKVGDLITFKIGYANPRDEEATLTITDKLEEGLTFIECTPVVECMDGIVEWEIKVGPSDEGSVTLVVRVNEDAETSVKNIAELLWVYSVDDEEEEHTEIEIPIISYKIVDKDSETGVDGKPVNIGDIITYRIGYINPTGEMASLEITDTLDESLEFINATDQFENDINNYDGEFRTVTWNIANVDEYGFGYVTLTVKVTDRAEAATVNTANLIWTYGDDDTEDENPNVINPIASYKMVDIDSEAGVGGKAVKPGEKITYIIGYVNPTGKDATLIITDELVAGLSYEDSSNNGVYTEDDRIVTWTIGLVEAGGAGFVTLEVRVTSEAEASITNKAILKWNVGDGDPEIEDPDVTNPVESYKLVISEAGKDDAVIKIGDIITYKIGYVNPTDKPASLTITDNLVDGLIFMSATGETLEKYGSDSRRIIWEIGNVDAGAGGYVTLTVRVAELTSTVIKNVANMVWITADGPTTEDPDVVNPTGSYKIVDSDCENGVDGAVVRPGDEITYKIGYVNPTSKEATLIITDELDIGLSYVSCTGDGKYKDGTVAWTIDPVGAGGFGCVTVTVKVNENAEAIIKNTAEMAWYTGDDDPSETEKPFVENPVGSYKIVARDSEAGVDGAAVKPGDVITYKIAYVNPLEEAAELIITDKLDIGLSYEYCSDDGIFNEGDRTVTWTIGEVEAGAAGSVTLIVTVNESAEAVIRNIAEMAWYTGDIDPFETEEPFVENPIVSYKVVDSSSESGQGGEPVTVGNEITYRIGYVNPMDGSAELTITDKLDPCLTYVSCEGGGVYNAVSHTVTWEIGKVAAEGVGYVTLKVRVNENAGATIKNKAVMEWTTDGGLNKEEDPEIEIPVGSFKIVDSTSAAGVNGASVKPGETITYKLGYVNPTGEDAELTITDTLDAGMTYVSSTGGGVYNPGTRTVTWTIGLVEAGRAGSVTLKVTVNENAGAVINNRAIMEWNTGGEDPLEKLDVENPVGSFKIVDSSSLAGVGGVQVNIGDEITYRIGYVNPTGKPAKLTVTDSLEAGLTYVSSTGGGIYDSANRTVTWTIDEVADDGVGYVTLTVRVNANAGAIIRNIAQMTWDAGDDDPEIEKPETENPVKPADRLYTVTYKANGGIGEHIVRGLPYGTRHTILSRSATGIYRNNYRFTGWNTQPNGRGISYAPGDIITVRSDIILYAQWEKTSTSTKPSTDKPKGSDDTTSKLDKDNHLAYIIGYPDNTVGSEKNITRAEAATVFFRLLTQETREKIWFTTNPYTDVSPDAWYNNAISTLTNAGILTGYPDGSFEPNKTITRAEFASIAVRFVEISVTADGGKAFSDINGHWAERDIKLAAALGYIEGYVDGTYRPNQPITRAEVAALLNRVLNRHVEKRTDLLNGMVTWPDNNIANWYYYDIQEATNSHYYTRKGDDTSENWTELRPVPDWSLLERPGAKPWDVKY